MKNIFSTKTIVATGLGAALFMVLFMYVKIPSPIPETSIQTAYGVSVFFAAVFGPLCGFLVAFIGHALNDFIQYGSPWWSWIIASGVSACIAGLAYFKLRVEEGELSNKDILVFNLYQVIGNFVAWVICAPVLDIVIYKEPVSLLLTQGMFAFIANAITAGVIGTILLVSYAKTKTKKGSLSKE